MDILRQDLFAMIMLVDITKLNSDFATFARIPTASLPITVTTALINKTSLSKFIYISSIIPHSGDFAKSFNYKYFINVGKSVLWVEGQGRWFAVNETGEHCSPLPIFVRITKKFVKK